MDLQFKKTVYKINLYGADYEMRKPTVREIVGFQKSITQTVNDDDKIDRLTDFFVSLGLVREAIDAMQMDHMIQLAETLAAVDKKKIDEFAFKKAKMAHFYHFSDESMDNMLADVFQDYWLAVESVEAFESLSQLNIAVYTSLKQEDRDRLFNELNKKAKSIFIEKDKAQLSTEEVAKLLATKMSHG